MKVPLIKPMVLLFLLISSCGASLSEKLSYEIINNEKHVEITKDNLITLFEMEDEVLKQLLLELHYEKDDKNRTNAALSYIQKTDTTSGVFQTISVRYSPGKVIDITWVSFDKKDRFKKFIQAVENGEDVYSPKMDAYLLKQSKKRYLAQIKQELSVITTISLTAM